VKGGDIMLTENDMSNLAGLTSKLAVEGYDVQPLKDILATERGKINLAEAADLTQYFPIKDTIQLKMGDIKYGLQPLAINLQLIVERLSGVFDKNTKPEMFESILKNAIYNCLKNIKAQYAQEIQYLINGGVTTTKTATPANPLSFTFGGNTLYTEAGSIDTAVAWAVSTITDSSSNNLSGGGVTTTATPVAPILLALTDGNGTLLNFSCVSGSFDGSTISASTAVTIGGGE
jgi:hypothetical protein